MPVRGPARGPEPWRKEPGGSGLHGAAFEGGWSPARGWRRGVSEGVEPSEWALYDKIDGKHPFWALKSEDEPRDQAGRRGAPASREAPGRPTGGRPYAERERGSSRPPPPGPPGSRGGGGRQPGGLERRCSYRSSPGGRRSCSSMAVQASTSPGGTAVVRGAVHPDGPPGSTGAGLPGGPGAPRTPCACPWRRGRRWRTRGRAARGGRPRAPTSSCPGKRPPGSSCPRGTGTPTSNRTPAYRSRTPTHQGKIANAIRGRRTGETPERTGMLPPGRRTGMLPGMANGNSTSAYRSECVGEQGAGVPVRRRQADARLGRPPRAAIRGRPWCRRRGVLGRPRARGSAPEGRVPAREHPRRRTSPPGGSEFGTGTPASWERPMG